MRTSSPVARIDARDGRARAVELEDGTRLPASAVVTAVDVPSTSTAGGTRTPRPSPTRWSSKVEQHAPGSRSSITARTVRMPTLMAEELRWPGAHPMHLDISLDQLAFLRPTRALSGHVVPGVAGLFTCGASTAPVGGIACSSGRAAALEVLKAT